MKLCQNHSCVTSFYCFSPKIAYFCQKMHLTWLQMAMSNIQWSLTFELCLENCLYTFCMLVHLNVVIGTNSGSLFDAFAQPTPVPPWTNPGSQIESLQQRNMGFPSEFLSKQDHFYLDCNKNMILCQEKAFPLS